MKHQSQPSIQSFFNLSGDSDVATQLRDRFIFKVVPMLNPDGCIVGNTRCSLAARDLNRQYKSVIKEAFPSVFNVKTLVRRLVQSFFCYINTQAVNYKWSLNNQQSSSSPQNVLRQSLGRTFVTFEHRLFSSGQYLKGLLQIT